MGATRILAPAARSLVRDGRDVLAVARGAAGLGKLKADLGPRVRTFAADARAATFPDRLAEAIPSTEQDSCRLGGALLYGPAVSAGTVDSAAELADGPVVLVLTSRAAVPAAGSGEWQVTDLPPAPPGVRRLVLGWRPDRTWHDAEEVSAAAVALFQNEGRQDTLLGLVNPWAERPR